MPQKLQASSPTRNVGRVTIYRKSDGQRGSIEDSELQAAIDSGEYAMTPPDASIPNPMERFMRGLTSREQPLPPSPSEDVMRTLAELAPAVGPTGEPVRIGAQLAAGMGVEASQGMRRGALTLAEARGKSFGQRSLAQVKSAAQGLSGLLSPILSPGATRQAGERLSEGDVTGAIGEMVPTAATLGLGAGLRSLAKAIRGEPVFVRGKPFPTTAEGKLVGSKHIMAAGKSEFSNIAAEEATSIAKKPFIKVAAQVAGEPSVDTYIATTQKAARTIKDTSQAIYKEIESALDARGNPVLVGIGEQMPVRIGGVNSSVFAERRLPLAEALERRSKMWKDVYKTRDPDQRRLLADAAAEFDQKIDDSLRKAKDANPDLSNQIDEAQRLWRKGSAMSDWAGALEDKSVGFPQHEVSVPGSQPAKIRAGGLIESIKDLEARKSSGVGRLTQAVGKENAQAIKDIAALMANEEAKPTGMFNAIGRLFIGPRGLHAGVYERLGEEGLESLGKIVISKGISYPRFQLYLKNSLKVGAATTTGIYWLGRAVAVAESGDISAPEKTLTRSPGMAQQQR